MGDIAEIWQVSPLQRTETDWRRLLDFIVDRLALFLRTPLRPDKFRVNDEPTHASFGATLTVIGVLSEPLDLVLDGWVSIGGNRGQWVAVSANLLLFIHGQRLGTHRKHAPPNHATPDHFYLRFLADESGGHWESQGLICDEYGEYEGIQRGPSTRE